MSSAGNFDCHAIGVMDLFEGQTLSLRQLNQFAKLLSTQSNISM